MTGPHDLKSLGWTAEFLGQLDIHEIGTLTPARVSAIHRDRIDILTEAGQLRLGLLQGLTTRDLAVGDWVLLDPDEARVVRLLERKSLLHRRAAGVEARNQLIAANVDTLFITTSLNADFNPARLERYLALAHDAGVVPVFVLTKADLCDDPGPYLDTLRTIAPTVPAMALDARDSGAAGQLADWCGPGQTVVLLGSSGVGKSTLAITLTGEAIATQDIREDDAKGRHTTTARSFHRLLAGGWLVDTPGMRELQLAGVEDGIDAVFEDIAALAIECRFSNCAHETEPGCAVKAAVEAGRLSQDRLTRWKKLRLEDARNTESLAQAHARDRAFGRMIKRVKSERQR